MDCVSFSPVFKGCPLEASSQMVELLTINFLYELRVSHIFREGNQVADFLAKYGVVNSSPMWWSSAPSFCSHFIYSDYYKKGSYRFC